MNHTKTVLIIGAGHLAYRVNKLVVAKGYEVVHVSNLLPEKGKHIHTVDMIDQKLKSLGGSQLKMIYVLNEEDEDNLEVVIALMALELATPVTTSLFNENISPYLQAAHANLHILNPARIAAPHFVEALYQSLDNKTIAVSTEKTFGGHRKRASDSLLKLLVSVFSFLIAAAIAYFHYNDGFSWLDATYFVIVTVATVGYGDINLHHASSLSKVVGIALILCSTVFIWLIFSLTIDAIIKKRVQLSLGRKKYHFKNHIILCGLGRLGYFIAKELERKGEKILVIETNENSPNVEYFKSRGINVYIGNARLPRVLQDAGVANARALISAVNDDYANIEIGLNTLSFQPDIRLILRIFDDAMARTIKEKLGIHLTFCMTAIADEQFVAKLSETVAIEST